VVLFKLFMQFGFEADAALKAGIAEYDARKGDCSPAALAVIILKKTSTWKPEMNGKEVLTPGLRVSLANALGGLSYNIAAAKTGKPVV
jgi:hypothetical protein